MSQRDEVIKTLKSLNRPSTLSEVYEAMKDIILNWKTQTPKKSIATYLTTTNCIQIDKSHSKRWTYTVNAAECEAPTESDPADDCSQDDSNIAQDNTETQYNHHGIYIIGINESVKLKCAGYIFKIGCSSQADNRLLSYARSLPFNPIEQIAFFEVPNQIENLTKIESDLRDAVLNSDLGVSRYYTLGQKEWLQVLKVDFENKREVSQFVMQIQTKLQQLIEETLDQND